MATYPQGLWLLATGAFLNMAGYSFVWPLTMVYITGEMGQSTATAGVVMMLEAGAGAAGSLCGGLLYDKMGGKRALLWGSWGGLAAALILAFSGRWEMVVCGLLLLSFFFGAILPAIQSAAGTLAPAEGQAAFRLVYLFQNVGVALGTAMGGRIAEISFSYAFLTNALFFVLFGLVIRMLPLDTGAGGFASRPRRFRAAAGWEEKGQRSGLVALLLLGGGLMCCLIAYSQWYVAIPAHMVRTGFALSDYSVLWLLNGLMVILVQPLDSRFISRWFASPARRVAAGSTVLVLSSLTLFWFDSYAGLVTGMVLLTLGEVLVWPGVPAAAQETVSPSRAGFSQGVVSGFGYGGRMLGPLLGGLVYDPDRPMGLPWLMTAMSLLALGCFIWHGAMRVRLMAESGRTTRDLAAGE